jgi:hypothetical protein
MRLLKIFTLSILVITFVMIAAKANAQSIDELYQGAKTEALYLSMAVAQLASTSHGLRSLSSNSQALRSS